MRCSSAENEKSRGIGAEVKRWKGEETMFTLEMQRCRCAEVYVHQPGAGGQEV